MTRQQRLERALMREHAKLWRMAVEFGLTTTAPLHLKLAIIHREASV
jgi:hypothetical protein